MPETLQELVQFIPFFLMKNDYDNIQDDRKVYYLLYTGKIEDEYQQYRYIETMESDALIFWLNTQLALLSQLAIRCLSIPISSSDCERAFSIYKGLMDDKPNAKPSYRKAITIAKFNKDRL